ncbi:MAG: cobalt transporter subunit [Rhizobiales bacterium NRL2]|jgi:cobalt transporter subunit CbtB|nr:MAG: cobalt transporter subunit [Rhizobiales bacterium NRL2]
MTTIRNAAAGATDRRAAVIPAAVAAILIGAFLVFGAGLAQSSTLHNAAHDGRHSFAFPCH